MASPSGEDAGFILHILTIGFHHKHGSQLEFCFPPLAPGQRPDSGYLPEEWKNLPGLALPDGAHNYEEDNVYFVLPSLTKKERSVFCVSCYRQIDSSQLITKTDDVTRSSVQKSVVVVSKVPLFGAIRERLSQAAQSYFEMRDFSRIDVLQDTFGDLRRSFSKGSVMGQMYMGLSVKDLLLPAAFATGAVADDREAGAAEALLATLDALAAAVDFVNDNIETVNLDGAIGLRTIEGQSDALLARYWSRLPRWAAARLTELRNRAGLAASRAVRSVRRRTPVYYANAGNMISEHFWDTFYPTRPLQRVSPPPPPTSAPPSGDANFEEKFSDDCIREFYGPDGKSSAGGCTVSERCWRGLVLPRGLTGYSLTHQLFYLMNGVQANCLSNLTARARVNPPAGQDGRLSSVFDDLCARIFVEAGKLEAAGFPKPDRDLFMEQVGLCGLAGYPEFAQWRWLPALLSWQRPSGCYGEFAGESIDPRNFQPNRYGNYRRRRKRAEMRMPRGCLSHRTSVAMDALMSYCRRIVELLAEAS